MAQFKKYKIMDEDTGESHIVSLDHDPSPKEMDQILNLKKQEKESLAQADRNSNLFTWPNVKQAGIDVVKTTARVAPMAAATTFAPEVFGPLALGQSAAEALKQVYNYYKGNTGRNSNNPNEVDNISPKWDMANTLSSALLYGASGLRGRQINAENPNAGRASSSASIRESLNKEALNRANTPRQPINAEFTEPIDANVLSSYPNFTHKPTPPRQITVGNGTKQIEAPNAIPLPGEVQPPPIEESTVTASKPKTGFYSRQVNFGNWGSTKAKTKYYKGEFGDTLPKVEEVNSVPKEAKDITPSKTETLKVEPKVEEQPVTQEEQVKEEPTKLENNWLRQTDTQVLQNMQTGASGKLRTEIDNVLGERGIVKNQPKPKEVPPKSQESQLESGINEATFNEYNDILSNLPAHGKEIGSHILRDVAKLGKDAGLDSETVKNDILENLHPEITNPAGRVQIAIRRAFNPKLKNEE